MTSTLAARISHHGAVDGVTGSCHQLSLPDGQSVLVDCGLFQGAETSREGAGAERLDITFPIDRVRALVVSHVHIDHVGRIPRLLAAGYRGPIVCSQASAVLLPLVLEDALKVGFTRDQALISGFLKQIRQQTIAVPYKQWRTIIRRRSRAARQAVAGGPHPRLGLRRIRSQAGPGDTARRLLR
jgi:metallo-beta-lactamase family protein